MPVRTQTRNKEICIQKLKEIIAEAAVEPKERQQWEGIGDKGKSIRYAFCDAFSDSTMYLERITCFIFFIL